MPLWNIYHTEGTFASQEIRNKFAQDITKIYSRGENGLPAFYVVVQFIPLPTGHVFVGGEARDEKPFVRLVIQHMAVHSHEGVHMEDFPKQFSDYINATIKPYIADKGYDWEITVTDTQREFWRFNGIAPPPWRSKAERVWARDGRPSEWEGNKE